MSNRIAAITRDSLVGATVVSAILAAMPSISGAFGPPKLLLLCVLSFAALAFALAERATAKRPVKRSTRRRSFRSILLATPWPALALVLLGSAISASASYNPAVSIIGRYNRYGGLLTVVAFSAFFIAATAAHARSTAITILFAAAGTSSIAAVYGVAQSFGLDPIAWAPTDGTRTFATFGNSTFAGAAMGIGLIAVFGAAMLTAASLRPLWALGAIAMLVTAIYAGSNGFVLALGGGALATAWIARKQLGPWPLRVSAAAIALVAVIALIGVAAPNTPGPAGAAGRALRESMHPRAEYWGAAIRSWQERPILGWGGDTFAQVYPRFRSSENANELGLVKLTDEIHNVPLQRFSEGGLATGAGWILLILQGLGAGRRPPKKKRDLWLLLGGVGTVAAYLAQSLVSIDVISLSIYMWAGLAIIECTRPRPDGSSTGDGVKAGGGRGRKKEEALTHPSRRRAVLLGAGATAALIASIASAVTIWGHLINADREFTAAQRRSITFETAATAYGQAVEKNPYEPRYRAAWSLFLADASLRATNPDPTLRRRAIEIGEEAFRLEPGNPYHAVRLAILYENAARAGASKGDDAGSAIQVRTDLEAAGRWYRKALEYDPRDPDIARSLCLVENKLAYSDESELAAATAECPVPSAAAAARAAANTP